MKRNKLRVSIENVTRYTDIPGNYYFRRWVKLALRDHRSEAEVHIRIVDKKEMAFLNKTYRGKTGTTNILSFPFDAPVQAAEFLLGDLVICAPVIKREAREQKKELMAHWAHMVIHGTLHLLGFDHIKKKDAVIMEKMEINLLEEIGYPNPY